MVRIDVGDVNSAEDLTGYDRPLPGRYHVVVRTLDDTFQKSKTALIVGLEVLAGTVGNQAGKTCLEYIQVDGRAAKRSLKFALATGLITEADLRGSSLDIDFAAAAGKDLIIDLQEREYSKDGETKKTVSVTFLGFHRVGSPGAAGVPLGDRPPQQPAPAAPPPQPPGTTVVAPDAVPDDEWGDL